MPITILHLSDKQMKIVRRAVIDFTLNYDSFDEEDLEMTEKEVIEEMAKLGFVDEDGSYVE